MAQKINMTSLLVMAMVSTLLFQNAAAKTYIVGDKIGWAIPPAVDFYATWAAGHNFTVGDILFFNFTTGSDVARVRKDDYDACNEENPISIFETGPVNVTLDSPGNNYFICTIGESCPNGQVLAITVNGTTNTTTPSSPPPSGVLMPPPPPLTADEITPPPSAAPALASVGGGAATLFVMVISLLLICTS